MWEYCACGGKSDFMGADQFAGSIWTNWFRCPECGREFGVGIEERPDWPEEVAA